MLSGDDIRGLRLPRSAILILLLFATGGGLLSLHAGAREASQYRTLERLRMTEAAEAHFIKATDHLAARENLAVTVSAPFDPRDLAGRGTASDEPAGFRYERDAPLGDDTRTDVSEEAA